MIVSDHRTTVPTEARQESGGAETAGSAVLCIRHGGLTEGIHSLLATRFAAVVVVTDERSLHSCVEALHPDLAVLDLSVVAVGGILLTTRLRARYPDLRILLLVEDDDTEVARAAGAAGANGCVLLGAVGIDLLPAVEELLAGGTAFWSEGIRGTRRRTVESAFRTIRGDEDPKGAI